MGSRHKLTRLKGERVDRFQIALNKAEDGETSRFEIRRGHQGLFPKKEKIGGRGTEQNAKDHRGKPQIRGRKGLWNVGPLGMGGAPDCGRRRGGGGNMD